MVTTSATMRDQLDPADIDLKRRVVSYLVGRHVPGLRHLQVEAHNGTVTLRGRVHTFYEKQLCQNCCRRVAGVVNLVDNVDVAHAPATGSLV
jgi:osmotically-inducible protein OsmY